MAFWQTYIVINALPTVYGKSTRTLPWDMRFESSGSDTDITEQCYQKVMLKITFK